MLNKVFVMGRLVEDPELRVAGADNISVASFRVACERDYKDKNGEKQADFFTCVAWRGTAEFVSKYFSKGRMIVVDGRLQQRSWKDNDGNNRSAVEIVAENVYFGESKREVRGDAEPVERDAQRPANEPVNVAPKSGGPVPIYMDDYSDGELPF